MSYTIRCVDCERRAEASTESRRHCQECWDRRSDLVRAIESGALTSIVARQKAFRRALKQTRATHRVSVHPTEGGKT